MTPPPHGPKKRSFQPYNMSSASKLDTTLVHDVHRNCHKTKSPSDPSDAVQHPNDFGSLLKTLSSESTQPTLLPHQMANLVSQMASVAKLTIRAATFVAEIMFESTKYSTLKSLSLTKTTLTAALTAARTFHYIKNDNGDIQSILFSEENIILDMLDKYTNLGVHVIHHTVSLAEIFSMTGFYLVENTLKTSFTAAEESVRLIDGMLGSNETSRLLSSIIELWRKELIDESRPNHNLLASLRIITKAMTAFALLQIVTSQRTKQSIPMTSIYRCAVAIDRKNDTFEVLSVTSAEKANISVSDGIMRSKPSRKRASTISMIDSNAHKINRDMKYGHDGHAVDEEQNTKILIAPPMSRNASPTVKSSSSGSISLSLSLSSSQSFDGLRNVCSVKSEVDDVVNYGKKSRKVRIILESITRKTKQQAHFPNGGRESKTVPFSTPPCEDVSRNLSKNWRSKISFHQTHSKGPQKLGFASDDASAHSDTQPPLKNNSNPGDSFACLNLHHSDRQTPDGCDKSLKNSHPTSGNSLSGSSKDGHDVSICLENNEFSSSRLLHGYKSRSGPSRANEPSPAPLDPPSISSQPPQPLSTHNLDLVRNLQHYMRYSSATYGQAFMNFTGISKNVFFDHTTSHANDHAFAHHVGVNLDDILLSSYTDVLPSINDSVCPIMNFVTVDHKMKAVVLSCRGSLGLTDVLVDLTCIYQPIDLDYDDNRGNYYVHSGMFESALILKSGRVMQVVREALEAHPSYGLVLCGHSLGGGVTSLLAVLLSRPVRACDDTMRVDGECKGKSRGRSFQQSSKSTQCECKSGETIPRLDENNSSGNMSESSQERMSRRLSVTPTFVTNDTCGLPPGRSIHCYTYGSPCIASPDLAMYCQGLVTSIVYGYDIVPTLSLGALKDFKVMAFELEEEMGVSDQIIRTVMSLYRSKLPFSNTRRPEEAASSEKPHHMTSNDENKCANTARPINSHSAYPSKDPSQDKTGTGYSLNNASTLIEHSNLPISALTPSIEDVNPQYKAESHGGLRDETQDRLWSLIKTLRANNHNDKLYPAGKVYLVESEKVAVPPQGTAQSDESRYLHLSFVDDVQARFSEPIFCRSMISDHSPKVYEHSLDMLLTSFHKELRDLSELQKL